MRKDNTSLSRMVIDLQFYFYEERDSLRALGPTLQRKDECFRQMYYVDSFCMACPKSGYLGRR